MPITLLAKEDFCMKKLVLLTITMGVLLFAGCVTGEKMTLLRPGMSKEEVEKILGRPDGFEATGTQEAYKYSKRLMSGWSWDQADYVLLFDGGKLVKYGPGTIYFREVHSNTQNINIHWY